MGYPMTFTRFIGRMQHRIFRGGILGDEILTRFADGIYPEIESDLERLKIDSLDGLHLQGYADKASITPEQAKIVLETFFRGGLPIDVWNGEKMIARLYRGEEVIATHQIYHQGYPGIGKADEQQAE